MDQSFRAAGHHEPLVVRVCPSLELWRISLAASQPSLTLSFLSLTLPHRSLPPKSKGSLCHISIQFSLKLIVVSLSLTLTLASVSLMLSPESPTLNFLLKMSDFS